MYNNSYYTQLAKNILTYWLRFDDRQTSCWLFTTWWSTWHGNHLAPYVAELIGSCFLTDAYRGLSKVPLLSIWSVAVPLRRPLSPCPSRWHNSRPQLSLWWLTCELWYTALPCSGRSGLCTSCERVHFFLCSFVLGPNFLPVSPGAVYQLSHTWDSRSHALSSCNQWTRCPTDKTRS